MWMWLVLWMNRNFVQSQNNLTSFIIKLAPEHKKTNDQWEINGAVASILRRKSIVPGHYFLQNLLRRLISILWHLFVWICFIAHEICTIPCFQIVPTTRHCAAMVWLHAYNRIGATCSCNIAHIWWLVKAFSILSTAGILYPGNFYKMEYIFMGNWGWDTQHISEWKEYTCDQM